MITIVAATINTPTMAAIIPIRMTTKRVGGSSIDEIIAITPITMAKQNN